MEQPTLDILLAQWEETYKKGIAQLLAVIIAGAKEGLSVRDQSLPSPK